MLGRTLVLFQNLGWVLETLINVAGANLVLRSRNARKYLVFGYRAALEDTPVADMAYSL